MIKKKKKIKINSVIAEVNVPDSLLEMPYRKRLEKEKERQKRLYGC